MDLDQFALSSYRNSKNLIDFEVSKDFCYIVTAPDNLSKCAGQTIKEPVKLTSVKIVCSIDEYKRGNPEKISFNLCFQPIFIFPVDSTIFICTKDELYLLKNTVEWVMNIKPLTLNFSFYDKLVSVSENVIKLTSVLNSHEAIFELDVRNGICSAYCIDADLLYLGYENGAVIAVTNQSFVNIKPNLDKPKLSFKLVCKINEPILKILKIEGFLFLLALNSIHRINLNSNEIIFTRQKSKDLFIYKNILINQKDKIVEFFDLNLKHIKSSIFGMKIKKIIQSEGSLFVGFECGLLIEYSISKILDDLVILKLMK